MDLQEVHSKNGLKMTKTLIEKLQEQIKGAQGEEQLPHQAWETQGFFDEDFELNDQYLFIREYGRIMYLEMS